MKLRPAKLIYRLGLFLIVVTLTSCQTPISALLKRPAPTPQCVEPKLTLGAMDYPIKSLAADANGQAEMPAHAKDTAYWLEGTTVHYVFELPPTRSRISAPATP